MFLFDLTGWDQKQKSENLIEIIISLVGLEFIHRKVLLEHISSPSMLENPELRDELCFWRVLRGTQAHLPLLSESQNSDKEQDMA